MAEPYALHFIRNNITPNLEVGVSPSGAASTPSPTPPLARVPISNARVSSSRRQISSPTYGG